MPQRNGMLDELLLIVRDRLREGLPSGNDETVFISADPDSRPPNAGEFWYVVSPSPAVQFSELQEGGGLEQSEVVGLIVITIHTISDEDTSGRDDIWFTDRDRGLLPKVNEVLGLLSLWWPIDDAGWEFTNEPLHSQDINWGKPGRLNGSAQIGFQFRMDLAIA